MTEKRLEELKSTQEEIARLNQIISITQKCWHKGKLKILSRKLRFTTAYGGLADHIDLERDEVEALTKYLSSKRDRLEKEIAEA